MRNSKGLFGYNKDTDVSFSVTLRNQEGTGSGYVSRALNDTTKLDTIAFNWWHNFFIFYHDNNIL